MSRELTDQQVARIGKLLVSGKHKIYGVRYVGVLHTVNKDGLTLSSEKRLSEFYAVAQGEVNYAVEWEVGSGGLPSWTFKVEGGKLVATYYLTQNKKAEWSGKIPMQVNDLVRQMTHRAIEHYYVKKTDAAVRKLEDEALMEAAFAELVSAETEV